MASYRYVYFQPDAYPLGTQLQDIPGGLSMLELWLAKGGGDARAVRQLRRRGREFGLVGNCSRGCD